MSPSGSSPSASRLSLGLALFSLYAIWGSTYLAMRVAMDGFPPFRMAALRFLVAGVVMLGIARLRGEPFPTLRQWRNAAIIGTLLLACGNGGVAFAEQTVSSGLAALMVSAMPLWMALFGGLWGRWPATKDWVGLVLGFGGIVLLNVGSELSGSGAGVAALMFATAAWAFGSLWSRRLDLPKGMMAAGAEMFTAAWVLVAMSLLRGEQLPPVIPARAIWALGYLVVFGSLVAYTAYLHLLARVPAPVASSYAYVNPVVALVLGAALAGERLPHALIVALPLILTAVALVLRPAPARVSVPGSGLGNPLGRPLGAPHQGDAAEARTGALSIALRTPRPNRG
ncbi:MAG TPA: drug/metabolite exporter YedA [Myxococcaceae bacterium]|nr:drug/metabolite exporter YedA [Myxococcaceae bacterium]